MSEANENQTTSQDLEKDVTSPSHVIDLEKDEEVMDNPCNKKRKRTASVWLEFTDVKLPSGEIKAQCIHCKGKLSKVGGTTSHLMRHLKRCPLRKRGTDGTKQQHLTVEKSLTNSEVVNIGNHKYDHAKMREAISHFILMHEHPFRIVEQEGYVHMMKTATPLFQKISRTTAKSDCVSVYENEKKKLKNALKSVSKISLTTDLWKSTEQQIEYMVVTGYFIDSNWVLQKRVLSFVHIPPPRAGVDIADALYKCMVEWGIENKVFTISVDNATYNDSCLRCLKETFGRNKNLPLGGKLMHVRCSAHILNLVVQDGLSTIGSIIFNVRESIKYIKNSEARLLKFAEVVKQLGLPGRRLILDCPTRWNSTYDMLVLALQFKDAFPSYQARDSQYQHLPSSADWEKIEKVCEILEVCNDATEIISGSEYPTSNLFLEEVYRLKEVLNEKVLDENEFICVMARKMRDKFEKYWGEVNLLMAIAAILDPRFKMVLIDFCFPLIYRHSEVQRNIQIVRTAIFDLYREYDAESTLKNVESNSGNAGGVHSSNETNLAKERGRRTGRAKFQNFVKTVETSQSHKYDLEIYLEEGVYRCEENFDTKFDAIEWWKANKLKFPVLSKMAADILAIPITTVAAESTFSAGSRVIETYRASLAVETVQACICGADWLRHIHGIKRKTTTQKKENDIEEIILPIT